MVIGLLGLLLPDIIYKIYDNFHSFTVVWRKRLRTFQQATIIIALELLKSPLVGR